MDDKQQQQHNFVIPESILSDLCSRFIITVPEEDRNDLIRIFFQIEIAHWFYLDFYCHDMDPTSSSSNSSSSGGGSSSGTNSGSSSSSSSSSSSLSSDDQEDDDYEQNLVRQKTHSHIDLKPVSIRVFAEQIFRHCPFLKQHSSKVNNILSTWKSFKHAVPTNGAIILDESMRYVLLVQGFWSKASWGFPKGKIFEEETEAKCAIREVLEETGYDISDRLVEDENLQININDQTIRLYIVTGVPKSTHFEPKTRREIKEVRWFAIDELPIHRKDNRTKYKLGYSTNAFFMVMPFLKSLKKWIAAKKSGQSLRSERRSKPAHKTKHAHCSFNHNHHQHHHHKHHKQFNSSANYYSLNDSTSLKVNSSNSYGINSSKKLLRSKSIENLNNSNAANNSAKKNFNNTQIQQKSTPNAFLKHFSNGFSNLEHQQANDSYLDSPIQQQSQYYQKLQQNKNADLLNLKQAALANNKKQNSYGKNLNNSNKKALNNSPFQQQQQINNTRRTRTISLNQKDLTSSNNGTKNLIHFNSKNMQTKHTEDQAVVLQTINNKPYQMNNNIRKQLNFSGPECWINFKFDMDSILQNLPPILDL